MTVPIQDLPTFCTPFRFYMTFLSILSFIIRSIWLLLAMLVNILFYTCIAILFLSCANVVDKVLMMILIAGFSKNRRKVFFKTQKVIGKQ